MGWNDSAYTEMVSYFVVVVYEELGIDNRFGGSGNRGMLKFKDFPTYLFGTETLTTHNGDAVKRRHYETSGISESFQTDAFVGLEDHRLILLLGRFGVVLCDELGDGAHAGCDGFGNPLGEIGKPRDHLGDYGVFPVIIHLGGHRRDLEHRSDVLHLLESAEHFLPACLGHIFP